MAVHLKTRRRLKALLIGALCMGVFGGIGIVWRQKQLAARILRDRDAGYVALEAEQYFSALHKIGPFLQRNQTDAEALFKYATARSHVEEANGKHLVDAISLYRRLLEVDPGHQKARENLLDIYVSVGFNSEILSATQGRDDPASLRARSIALANLGRTKEALDFLQRYCAAKPDDIRMQLFRCVQMQRDGRTVEQILDHVAQLQKASPDNPVFELLMSFGYALAQNEADCLTWVRKAAARQLSDEQLVEAAVELLDSHRKFEESLALIERAAKGATDPVFQRHVVARLYQNDRFDEVLRRVNALGGQQGDPDTSLVAHQALSLVALKRYDEARPVIQRLVERKGDILALAWGAVLSSLPRDGELPDDQKIVIACREALKADAVNPYFRLFLGDAMDRLGESEEATRQWVLAARATPIWPAPLMRLAQVLMASGRRADLVALSEKLQALAPQNTEVLATVAATLVRSAAGGDSPEVRQAQLLVDRILQLDPDNASALFFKVRLLVITDRAADAAGFIEGFLKSDPPRPAASYIALAQAADAAKLDGVEACFNRTESVHGPSLELARARAQWLVRGDKAREGVVAFESMRQKSKDGQALGWMLSWAGLLDAAQDDRAKSTWSELAASWPDNAMIRRYILASPSMAMEREVVGAAIAQLRDLIGQDGVAWRLAEARWILEGTTSLASSTDRERETVRAAALVGDVTRRYPEQLAARLLLGECLRRMGNVNETIEQLTVAARLAPQSVPVRLQLASLLQSSGNFERAKPLLEEAMHLLDAEAKARPVMNAGGPDAANAAGAEPTGADSGWRTLASLYAAQGETGRAIDLLRRAGSRPQADVDLDVAELQARQGGLNDQDCNKLLEKPTLRSVELVAENYRRQNRRAAADAALALLDRVETKPGERELVRGLNFQRQGLFDQAVPQLQLAIKAMPSNATAHRELISALIMLGEGDPAIAAVQLAAQQVPDHPRFNAMAKDAELIRAQVKNAPIRPLIVAMADPDSDLTVIAQALRATREATSSSKTVLQTSATLRPLADRAPSLVSLQNLLVDLYMSIGNYDDAALIATRTAELRPTDPSSARRAAEVLAAAARWSEALSLAREWRSRAAGNTLLPDLLIARAHLAQRDFAAAQQQLEPHLVRLPEDAVVADQLRSVYATSLVGLGRIPEARTLLEPSLETSVEVRSVWIRIAIQLIPDHETVARWLERVSSTVPKEAVVEHLLLANAWLDLDGRSASAQYRQAAGAQLSLATESMEAATSATANDWFALGALKEKSADSLGAEVAYRRSLAIDQGHLVAANNLSMVIVRRKGDLNEALRYALQAAEQAAKNGDHRNRPEFLDTVAQVQREIGNRPAAEKTILQAIELTPDNLSMRANLVQILLDQGKTPEAQRAFRELHQKFLAANPPQPNLQARINAFQSVLTSAPQNQ